MEIIDNFGISENHIFPLTHPEGRLKIPTSFKEHFFESYTARGSKNA